MIGKTKTTIEKDINDCVNKFKRELQNIVLHARHAKNISSYDLFEIMEKVETLTK